MRDQPLIVGLGGTLRAKSRTRSALREALKIAGAHGAAVELLDLRELNLPMYDPELTIEQYPAQHHASLRRFIDACRRADAMLWCSPTYHGTLSGVLKNALDHLELLSDDDRPYLQGRVVGLMAVADPLTFGAMVNAVYELRAWLAPTWVTIDRSSFDADFNLTDAQARRRITRLTNELLEFCQSRHER
jgi:FMN reductase